MVRFSYPVGNQQRKAVPHPIFFVTIQELHKAAESGTHERRIVALTNSCAEFDHTDETRHNVELQNNAALVLSKMLNVSDDEDEIRMVCAALEMVFRAQSTYVHVAFDKCASVMMPNLLNIMERAESGNMKHAGKLMNTLILCPYEKFFSHCELFLCMIFRRYHHQRQQDAPLHFPGT